MFPATKTSALFHSYNESRRHRELSMSGPKGQYSIGESYDHLTGTHGGITLKKTTSTSSKDGQNDAGGGFGMTAIRRPSNLDVKKQAAIIANMTKDLRTALVSHTSLRYAPSAPMNGSGNLPAAPSAGSKSFQSFDYVLKQSSRLSNDGNSNNTSIMGAVRDEEKSLPVSFLTSTELITVVIPYLKCLLAMQSSSQQHPISLHPGIRKHISAMMGSVPPEDDVNDTSDSRKSSVLIGRPGSAESSSLGKLNSQRTDGYHKSNQMQYEVLDIDEVDEFSD
mmetsp:Transcript_9208/g.17203  ORF Transcript_9208/g.17203 Transcript_9208/m.17203 type:complete len:279 (+) Transcript_9208:1130-1966(+)